MSHTATVSMAFKNLEILEKLCIKMNLPYTKGSHMVQLYETQEKAVFSVKLPGWRYPVAIKEDDTVAYDDYNGAWGKISELHKLQNRYSSEIVIDHAEQMGWSYNCEYDEQSQEYTIELTEY